MEGVSKALFIFFLLFLISFSESREILVGGKINAWKVPSSPAQSLNQWAENSRFRVGDALVWNYEEGKDSVLKVTKDDYETCNTTNPQQKFEDGKTTVELEKPGPHYFISGVNEHCQLGQKLVVVVLTPRHTFIAVSPAGVEAPAVAPSSGAERSSVGILLAVVVGILGLGVAFV